MIKYPTKVMVNPRTRALKLDPEEHIGEATRKILLYHYNRMIANEKGCIRGQSVEAVHDMRVSIRRMRSAFETFKVSFDKSAVKNYKHGLKQTAFALGGVRDCDVLLEKVDDYIKANPKEKKGLQPLLLSWQLERDEAQSKLTDYLKKDIYKKFKKEFEIFLNSPKKGIKNYSKIGPKPITVSQLAPKIIIQQLAQVRCFDTELPQKQPSTFHELRIEFKRFRYTLEFFQSVLDPSTKKLISTLKNIQDHLGDLNDAFVAYYRVEQFLENNKPKEITAKQKSASEKYQMFRQMEMDQLIDTFLDTWILFESPSFRKTLLTSMSEL